MTAATSVTSGPNAPARADSGFDASLTALLGLAAATVALHWIVGGAYGFHRDELQTLDDARHLAWGFVAYPPLTPFFARLSLALFGTSLAGFRFFASVASAAALVLTGRMARYLGGGAFAQLLAALAALPACLAIGALMQYVAFDYFCWTLAAYFVLRLLRSGDPRWWLAIGAAIGLGMETKYTMGFLVAGMVAGVLFSEVRRHLRSPWLWAGVAVSLLVFLPNAIWQAQHHFVSLEFLRHIHARDVRLGRTAGFLPDQLRYTLFAFPLAAAGLWVCLFSAERRRFRMLGWMYVVPLALFVAAKGRGYYLLPAYAMLYAAGSAWTERRLRTLGSSARAAIAIAAGTLLVADVAFIAAVFLPVARIGSPLWNFAIRVNGDLTEEIGWPELAQTVAGVRDSLPRVDRDSFGILAANYGEAGAIDLFGLQYGLPHAISGVNSFWYRTYPAAQPQTLIVLSLSPQVLARNFDSCTVAARTTNNYGVLNEETRDHPDIYVCRGLKRGWPEFWKDFHYYG